MTRRICLLRQSDFPAETHLRKNVDALVDAGYAVDVICLREPGLPTYEEYRGGTITRLPITRRRGSKLRYLFEYLAFFAMAAALLTWRSVRRRYDIVEVYNLPDLLVFAALPARLLGSKIVFYLFELMPEQAVDEYGLDANHPAARALRWIECRAVRSADRVITVSPYDEEIVVSRDVPERSPAVVLNVPEEDIFEVANVETPASRGTFKAITHGSLLRRYGIQTLIQATPIVLKEVSEFEVWVLGAGEYRSDLELISRDLGVSDRVRFLGWLPNDADVPHVIRQANVGVVSHLLPRLLPNKLFEYLALHRPVVASDTTSLRMLFDDEQLAFFRPGDEHDLAQRLIELYRDPRRAVAMAENARRVYEQHRWASEKRKYVRIHDELLDSRMAVPTTLEEPR
jgi:glycosyltransferase involved in cell wall biosynthesis